MFQTNLTVKNKYLKLFSSPKGNLKLEKKKKS